MNKQGRITRRIVARKAGVAESTVSLVVNDKPYVSDHTRERVLRVIRETGYFPHKSAQELRSNRVNTVGVVLIPRAEPYDPYLSVVLHGIREALKEFFPTGEMKLFFADEDFKTNVAYLTKSRSIGGALFVSTSFEDKGYILRLRKEGLPVVLINNRFEGTNVPYAEVDRFGSAVLAIRYLVEMKHRRIAFLSSRLSNVDGIDLLNGYESEMERNRLKTEGLIMKWDEELLRGHSGYDTNIAAGYQSMRKVLDMRPLPTAVFAAGDSMAIGGMKAVREAGLRIPEDISIVGFGDIEPAAHSDPPLTTIRGSLFELGKISMEKLYGVMNGKQDADVAVTLKTSLIERASARSLTEPR